MIMQYFRVWNSYFPQSFICETVFLFSKDVGTGLEPLHFCQNKVVQYSEPG